MSASANASVSARTAGTLVWVHEDYLDPSGPALTAHSDAPALFVFDEALLEASGASFKQVVFVYECLLEIPRVRILKGDTTEIILAAALDLACSRVATTDSASPWVAETCEKLRAGGLEVEVVEQSPFVNLGEKEEEMLDLKRFSRYWKVVGRRAMDKT